jgi:hypothetical protein
MGHVAIAKSGKASLNAEKNISVSPLAPERSDSFIIFCISTKRV